MSIAPAGWIVSPADERVMGAARLLADEKARQFQTYESDQFVARQKLRDRMGMIITIDRADTERCIANQY
jgi:MoxR-like ATPase